MSTFGAQTITLVKVTPGVRGRLGTPAATFSRTDVEGCRFRPFKVVETVDATDVVVATHKATLPPDDGALAITEADRLIYQGENYLINTVMRKPDQSGGIDHVTILCNIETP